MNIEMFNNLKEKILPKLIEAKFTSKFWLKYLFRKFLCKILKCKYRMTMASNSLMCIRCHCYTSFNQMKPERRAKLLEEVKSIKTFLFTPEHYITFKCDACRNDRIMFDLDVIQKDFSAEFSMPDGKCVRNIKHCKDNEDCRKWAIAESKKPIMRNKINLDNVN